MTRLSNARSTKQPCCHACASHEPALAMSGMILCPECGNKRCPRASDHRNACTQSNEPGQPGSIFGRVETADIPTPEQIRQRFQEDLQAASPGAKAAPEQSLDKAPRFDVAVGAADSLSMVKASDFDHAVRVCEQALQALQRIDPTLQFTDWEDGHGRPIGRQLARAAKQCLALVGAERTGSSGDAEQR